MSQVEIILGPTNTGKTFYAFEQMFSYQSGVFGFPLRLLARENYDKACKLYPINAFLCGSKKIRMATLDVACLQYCMNEYVS